MLTPPTHTHTHTQTHTHNLPITFPSLFLFLAFSFYSLSLSRFDSSFLFLFNSWSLTHSVFISAVFSLSLSLLSQTWREQREDKSDTDLSGAGNPTQTWVNVLDRADQSEQEQNARAATMRVMSVENTIRIIHRFNGCCGDLGLSCSISTGVAAGPHGDGDEAALSHINLL